MKELSVEEMARELIENNKCPELVARCVTQTRNEPRTRTFSRHGFRNQRLDGWMEAEATCFKCWFNTFSAGPDYIRAAYEKMKGVGK